MQTHAVYEFTKAGNHEYTASSHDFAITQAVAQSFAATMQVKNGLYSVWNTLS